MKIIKKGKYTDKTYKCKNCGCEIEIDYNDIIHEELYEMLKGEKIEMYFLCPECNKKIIIEKWFKNDINNNN